MMLNKCQLTHVMVILTCFVLLFHICSSRFNDGGPYHKETSSLICSINQWADFNMIETSVMKGLNDLIFRKFPKYPGKTSSFVRELGSIYSCQGWANFANYRFLALIIFYNCYFSKKMCLYMLFQEKLEGLYIVYRTILELR